MIRSGSSLVVIMLVLAAGCRTTGTAGSAPSASSSAVASAAPPASASVRPPLVIGPPTAGAREERERALLRFIESGEAATVEVIATDSAKAIDPMLRDELLSHRVPLRSVRNGKVVLSAPKVIGGTISNAERVLASMRAAFRACYWRQASTSHYEGRVEITLKVGPTGEVLEAKAVATPRGDASMLECMQARAKRAQFDAPVGDRPVTLSFSVTLSKE